MAKKIKLNEAPPIDYDGRPERMSPDIERKLRSREHPLGAHQSFPGKEGDENNFEEIIASKRFKDVIDKVKSATGLEEVNPQAAMSLQPMLMSAVQRVMSIESANKQKLEDLAVSLVVDQMDIPEGDLQFDAKLEKPTLQGMQKKPKEKKKKELEFKQPDTEDKEAAERLAKLDLEKQKRRLINSLIQGSSKKAHYMFHLVNEALNEIDPDLVNLYSLVMSVNDLMYWIMPDMEGMVGGGADEMAAGREEVDLETDPPTIKAKGIMFPILVHELWKGVMEYVSMHGLPSDPEFAEEVIGSEDTLPAEVWDLRLGPIIWEKFMESYPEDLLNSDDYGRIKNYLYYNIVSLEPEPFIGLAKEILSGSPRGKEMVAKIVDDIKKQLKDEDYEDATGEVSTPSDLPGLDDSTQPTQELDMDTILDKINKSGMESLTQDEKDFLYNL
jgi:hypothetical protein|tara:strand:- start:7467 stop:8792 length:1326 start_codon:yes stop_codon:yes gene_type:complete